MKKTSIKKYSNQNSLNNLSSKEWIKFTKSWFICNPPPRKSEEVLHPAKFPEELVEEFIRFFTKEGEIVLDPMVGVGSTLIACANTNRSGVGIELLDKYFVIAEKRVKEKLSLLRGVEKLKQLSGQKTKNIFLKVLKGDARDVVKLLNDVGIVQIDYCITSPPYWKMLKTSRGGVESISKKRMKKGLDYYYSDDERDLGNIEDYNKFVDELCYIFKEVYKLLKKGGYLTIIVQNIRTPEGEMKPLAWDIAYKLRSTYILKQEKIWCQDNKPLGIWGYPTEYVSNVHHHYCLIFKKPK